MSKGNHDTLVYRLSEILIKLNQGEKLNPKSLAEEFGVNLRTIQRDLNVRFAYLPLTKIDGLYSIDPAFLGKIGIQDIRRFAELAGVKGLFPKFSNEFLQDIFDSRIQQTLLIKGHNYESVEGREGQFKALEEAIGSHTIVSFDYRGKSITKEHSGVHPYKLINNKGIWYLAAKENGKLKTFSFTKIHHLTVAKQHYKYDHSVEELLEREEGIWVSEKRVEVVLKVSHEVTGYFKRRKLIVNQVIEKELEDGSLIISTKVGHPDQILPIVRYWIPHIQIISPDNLQRELEKVLNQYLQEK
jgi:predicted DNA-binding transcriptional regulator YafY